MLTPPVHLSEVDGKCNEKVKESHERCHNRTVSCDVTYACNVTS